MKRSADNLVPSGSLRNDAATWFAIMRGPERDAHRAEFEAWLDQSAFHREAYNRIAETFSLGKALKHKPLPTSASMGPSTVKSDDVRSWRPSRSLVAALGATAIAIGLTSFWFRTGVSVPTDRSQIEARSEPVATPTTIATRIGEIRQVRLADNSVVTLDTNSEVLVALGKERRELTLIKGRARFAVAHERRPFFVTAGSGTVRAVGTLFDVALDHGRVDVRLLSGAIDVAIKPAAAEPGDVRRLVAGEALRFGGNMESGAINAKRSADTNWPSGMRDFDKARLGDVIADANRYSAVPMRAASPDIADLRISGTFRVDDSRRLAANLAEVLGLAQLTDKDGIALQRDCSPAAQQNCRPPS